MIMTLDRQSAWIPDEPGGSQVSAIVPCTQWEQTSSLGAVGFFWRHGVSDRPALTAEVLRADLSYDPETGAFIRRKSRCNAVRVGDVAGHVNRQGYRKIYVAGKAYQASRLAWMHVYGQWPEGVIDHVNRHRSDNRIANLRDATLQQNAHNTSVTGRRLLPKGVYKLPRSKENPYRAIINVNNHLIHLGVFPTIAAAARAYLSAKLEMHNLPEGWTA